MADITDSLVKYTAAIIADIKHKMLADLIAHGPTTFSVLHRTSGEAARYVELAMRELIADGTCRWSSSNKRARHGDASTICADHVLEVVVMPTPAAPGATPAAPAAMPVQRLKRRLAGPPRRL